MQILRWGKAKNTALLYPIKYSLYLNFCFLILTLYILLGSFISYFLFLVSYFLFLISYFLFPISYADVFSFNWREFPGSLFRLFILISIPLPSQENFRFNMCSFSGTHSFKRPYYHYFKGKLKKIYNKTRTFNLHCHNMSARYFL